jgi:archaellum biogenesis protein FlaJ (TadC family)
VATPHPIIRPPDVGHGPQHPVRDDAKLAPTEDLDRQPDGVPHAVVGLTAGFSVILAMLVAFMYLTGSTVARVAAVALAGIAIPTLVATLRNKAARERDQAHPSR